MDRILEVKLRAPRPSAGLTTRPRVTALLDGAANTRLTLLSAPPGYGKSSALADWLPGSGLASAWLSLDERDNDPARFMGYLWAAAGSLGECGEVPAPRATAGGLAAAVDELVAHLDALAGPSIVVLDDFHVIRAPEVQAAVASLLEHLPPRVHVVVATRVDPAFPLSRLRANGELLELRAGALRFTVDEARSFLAHRMGLVLAEPDLEALVTRTEGWPAALQLTGLSLVGRNDVTRRVREFSATHRFVLDYVGEEVLDRLDPDLRDFLLRTCVLERLSGDLCDALTGRTDGAATLEHLERSNVLIEPLDEERQWYRYHSLFADLLRARLAAISPAELAVLHGRATTWFERNGMKAEAIEHALSAGEPQRAAVVLSSFAPDLIHTGEFATLRRWVARLPHDVVSSDLFLTTMHEWALVLSGETDGLEEHLGNAEAALCDAEGRGDPPALTVRAHHEMMRSVDARSRGEWSEAVLHAERALAFVPDGLPPEREALVVGDAQAMLGHALVGAGELERASEAYRKALPRLELAGNRLGVADITRNLARVEARRGRFRAALSACDEVLAATTPSDLPALAPVHLARGEILERTGSLDAGPEAERALALARRGGDPDTAQQARQLLERLGARPAASTPKRLVEPLTERELQVLRLVAAGRSNRQIAAELYLALGTVKVHVHTIAGKLGAANRVEAVARGRELGLLA